MTLEKLSSPFPVPFRDDRGNFCFVGSRNVPDLTQNRNEETAKFARHLRHSFSLSWYYSFLLIKAHLRRVIAICVYFAGNVPENVASTGCVVILKHLNKIPSLYEIFIVNLISYYIKYESLFLTICNKNCENLFVSRKREALEIFF